MEQFVLESVFDKRSLSISKVIVFFLVTYSMLNLNNSFCLCIYFLQSLVCLWMHMAAEVEVRTSNGAVCLSHLVSVNLHVY